jgi:two-component system NtrC family sensor kinase
MAKRGQKAKTRATATKRKKPVRKARPDRTKSGQPKSGRSKSSRPKTSNSKSENARLKSELGAARDRQAASAEVMRLISASPGDADQTLRRIAEIAERLFGASSVSLLIADGEHWGRTIRVGAGSERIVTALPLAHVAITPQYMPGAVYLENRQVHVSDADDPAARARWPGLAPARAAGTRTMSGTPLRTEGRAIGALIVHRDRPVPFTEDELALLQSFADQAAIATENARLINETREALERQTATADILKVIASSPSDLQPVFEAIAASSNKLIGGFSIAVLRFDGDVLHLAAFTPTNPKADEALKSTFPRPLFEFPHFVLVRDGETQQFTDTESEDVSPVLRGLARLRGYRSMLFTPLMSSGKPIGIISVTRKEPGTFAAHHVQLVRTFADQAVIAIENARLFDEVRAKTADLFESLQQQTATADVLKVISRSVFDLQAVLDTLVESAYKLCGANLGLLYLRGEEAFECRAIAGVGVAEASLLFKGRPIRAGRGTAAERVIMTGEVHSIPDFFADPEMDPRVKEMIRNASSSDSSISKIRSTLAVPMTRDDAVIGVMVIARAQTGAFPAGQIELLRTFADQAVIAIENARLFDEVQARTRELAASLDELRTAQDRLVQTEKLASLGQLTAGIAHEIKNPLNFVNNFSALSAELVDELNEVLRPAALDDKVREEIDELTQMLQGNLEKVVLHGKRADSIVKNMLLHSREGSGEQRSTDINAILDESLNLAYHGARAEKPGFNITLQRDFDADVAAIDAFPQEITRVFLNLITNGFYAAAKRKSEAADSGFEPVLTATTRNIGHAVEIRIRDNGTGIPADVKEKIFNPFFTTKPAGEGTGLGLSMSHDIIVKQHGGSIDVVTVPGQFTEFTIILPRTNNFSNKHGG